MSLFAYMHVCCSTPRCDLQEIPDAFSPPARTRALFKASGRRFASGICLFFWRYVCFFSYANVYRRDMDCHDSKRDLRVSLHRFLSERDSLTYRCSRKLLSCKIIFPNYEICCLNMRLKRFSYHRCGKNGENTSCIMYIFWGCCTRHKFLYHRQQSTNKAPFCRLS